MNNIDFQFVLKPTFANSGQIALGPQGSSDAAASASCHSHESTMHWCLLLNLNLSVLLQPTTSSLTLTTNFAFKLNLSVSVFLTKVNVYEWRVRFSNFIQSRVRVMRFCSRLNLTLKQSQKIRELESGPAGVIISFGDQTKFADRHNFFFYCESSSHSTLKSTWRRDGGRRKEEAISM